MNRVLLCSMQKMGNTWTQFVIFNYWNIKYHKATETLTFDELQKIHLSRYRWGFNHKEDGFPEVYHTHYGYDGIGFLGYNTYMPIYFDKFQDLIYLYRNPLDAIISYYHFIYNPGKISQLYRNPYLKLQELKNIEDFALYYLEIFLSHIRATKHRATVVLHYDSLRKDPNGFKEAISLIDDPVDGYAFKKAIEFSSFENIKKMSIRTGKPYMRGGPGYIGYFCRDGRSGQYKEFLDPILINYLKYRCKIEGITV